MATISNSKYGGYIGTTKVSEDKAYNLSGTLIGAVPSGQVWEVHILAMSAAAAEYQSSSITQEHASGSMDVSLISQTGTATATSKYWVSTSWMETPLILTYNDKITFTTGTGITNSVGIQAVVFKYYT
jgi:hypothetical protein